MNKKMGIVIATLTGAAVIGFGVYQSDAAQEEPKMNVDQIEQMVKDQYDGKITELELEKGLNKQVYEVEVKANGIEYDLYLDANSGEVLKERQKEDDDIDDEELNTSDSKDNVIEIEKVKEIALAEFAGTVKEINLDEDDNRLIYEVEIRDGNKEAEFDIDAITGEILKVEVDTDDED
ncbi:PepSY domain-containing protein [Oceanobacillus bengalensis]|uniref:PepSY domain-containing protein n=1 Tax=Oceanobacillus bengalensis TaxID=1435466 RepID=A0A494YSF9_9BACI|nr:PepSY domain-containing protein [Oceanobacillus bengalensis]RKQ12833.1 hypothetical protein D8M05_17800 [Oceanobacillus bengalensis]